jgi:molybdenum cofactor cytidylyltransferase
VRAFVFRYDVVPRTFGLIPAAGKSRRMGQPKLALPLGGRTVLECVVAAIQQASVVHVVVVVGPGGDALAALARTAGADVLQLTEDTAEMRQTIQRGLDWLESRFQPRDDDGWLLLPADHPCVDAGVVGQLLQARARHPQRSIFVPTYRQKRGHPPWIGWNHVREIRALPRDVGLNAYVRQHGAQTLEVPVETEAVLWDLDTPEDYRRLQRHWLA